MELIENLKQLILNTLHKKGWKIPNFIIEQPKDLSHGDLSSNIAMVLASQLKKSPKIIAEELKNAFDDKAITSVEVAGPGFLNFFMDQSLLTKVIYEINEKKQNYGKNIAFEIEKINIEYVSANPTGKLHVGHARHASVGDSLTRILTHFGHQVTREYYINDAGAQIYKLGMSVLIRYKQLLGFEDQLPEDSYHGDEIIDLAQEFYNEHFNKYMHVNYDSIKGMIIDRDAGEIIETFAKTRLLQLIKETLRNIGVEFDEIYTESYFYQNNSVVEVLKRLEKYTYEKDGALWLATTHGGDDKDRVLKKSNGFYTYLAPDIAYHANKLDRGFNKIINLWGSDHHGYISRLSAALKYLGLPANKFKVLILPMVKLIKDGQEFKMSKRTGQSLTVEQLTEWIGRDALRYYMIANSFNSHIEINVNEAQKQSSENPVFYIQYAHARINQLLNTADYISNPKNLNLLINPKEKELINHLNQFKTVLEKTVEVLEPHKITNYVLQLAKLFHSFYNSNKIFIDNKELEEQRLFLCDAVKNIIKLSLSLVGVSAPERM